MDPEAGSPQVCEGCQASFRIPAGKIPPGKTVILNCPKCRRPFSFTAPDECHTRDATGKNREELSNLAKAGFSESPASASPVSSLVFAEEEGDLAMICMEDAGVAAEIHKTLEMMEYQVLEVTAPHEALKTLRMHACKLVVADEGFGGADADRNPVLLYLERLPMQVRREMFVAMLSKRHSTLDSLVAFVRSINLVVNYRHLPDLERLLRQGISDHRHFYEAFQEAMREEGRY